MTTNHRLQRLQVIVDAQNAGIFGVPVPMVTRSLAELSSGMGKFGDAKKWLEATISYRIL